MGGGSGIYETDPYARSQEPCKAVLHLGYTTLALWEVENIVNYMRNTRWGPKDYHPLTHNCNCFCKQLAKFLGLSVPYWVNRVGRWATLLAPRCVVGSGVGLWDKRQNGDWSSAPPPPLGKVLHYFLLRRGTLTHQPYRLHGLGFGVRV